MNVHVLPGGRLLPTGFSLNEALDQIWILPPIYSLFFELSSWPHGVGVGGYLVGYKPLDQGTPGGQDIVVPCCEVSEPELNRKRHPAW